MTMRNPKNQTKERALAATSLQLLPGRVPPDARPYSLFTCGGVPFSITIASLAAVIGCSNMNSDTSKWNQILDSGSEASRCSLSAEQLASRSRGALAKLAKRVQTVNELPDGYALSFDGSNETANRVLEFVAFERGCCNFLRFELALEPNGGPIQLTLRGDADAKRFLGEMLRELGLSRPAAG